MENHWHPTAICGVGLILTGWLLIRSHRKIWRRQQQDPQLDAEERRHLRKRFLRRIQTSGMIALLGLAITIGDIIVWDLGPVVATLFWIAVMVIAFWIMLLALGDMTSSRAHYRTALKRTDLERQALERQAAQLKGRRLNGEPPP